jgi:hypothetical protein
MGEPPYYSQPSLEGNNRHVNYGYFHCVIIEADFLIRYRVGNIGHAGRRCAKDSCTTYVYLERSMIPYPYGEIKGGFTSMVKSEKISDDQIIVIKKLFLVTQMNRPYLLAMKIAELDSNRELLIEESEKSLAFAAMHTFEKTFQNRISHISEIANLHSGDRR